jgi:hypothetical protein
MEGREGGRKKEKKKGRNKERRKKKQWICDCLLRKVSFKNEDKMQNFYINKIR